MPAHDGCCTSSWPLLGFCCTTQRSAVAVRDASREMVFDAPRPLKRKPRNDFGDVTSLSEADPFERQLLSQAVDKYLHVVECRLRLIGEGRPMLDGMDEHDAMDGHAAMDATPRSEDEPEAEWELEEHDEPARQAVDDARRRALEAREFVERKRLEMQKMAFPAVPDERERRRRTDVSTASENWLEVQRMSIRAEHAEQERDRAIRADKEATEATNQAEIAVFLQQQGFRGPDLPKTKLFKKTYPLHCAVVEGNPRIVELLLRVGVDATRKDSTGKTALQVSLQNGNSQIVEMLHRATHLARSPSAEVLPTQAKETERHTPSRRALGGA